jgi:hypothetical protein
MNDDATPLIHAYLDGELTDQQRRELADWLRQSPGNVDRFVAECRLHSELLDAHCGAWKGVELTDHGGDAGREPARVDNAAASLPLAPIIPDAMSLNSPFASLGGFLFSYVAAAILIAVGLLIGWVYHVPIYRQTAGNAGQPVGPSLPPKPKAILVGRVTDMAGCRWANRESATALYADVPLGRKYALTSGLLEITYGSGAKVIIEGPCVYEVESKASGTLLVGRLTARVEKRGERRGERGEDTAEQQSPINNRRSPATALFAVRTPSAIVTDLGTEFGVEASPTGVTETQVFSGRVTIEGRGEAARLPIRTLLAGQAVRLDARRGMVNVAAERAVRFIRKMPLSRAAPAKDLIAQLDYSDTWSANSPTRAGSYRLMTTPESLRVENCHGNPPRSWVFSMPTAMTTWPYDNSPVPWPGFQVEGARSGFTETGFGGICYFGFEYGLRDDFIVQFDAVQTQDRINITIGQLPATIDDGRSLSVFFRAAGTGLPEVGLYTPSKGEVDAGFGSGIPTAIQWHNYAVRFDLREKRLTVWVDRKLRGTIELGSIAKGMQSGGTWAGLPWTARCVTVGGAPGGGNGRVWTDNFRVGAPRLPAAPPQANRPKKGRGG